MSPVELKDILIYVFNRHFAIKNFKSAYLIIFLVIL